MLEDYVNYYFSKVEVALRMYLSLMAEADEVQTPDL